MPEKKPYIYLSIDMDYWDDHKQAEIDINNVVTIAKRKNIPVNAVMNHQQLLKFANNSKSRILVNFDKHSDLTDTDIDELSCGSWVSYVKWASEGTYVWVSPQSGGCDCGGPIVIFGNADPNFRYRYLKKFPVKNNYKLTSWKRIRHRSIVSDIAISNYARSCNEVGISLSPDYSDELVQEVFRSVVKTYKLPYLRGRCNESYSRKLQPPKR